MKIVYLGSEIDSDKEREILTENEHGFKVTVTYKRDSWMSVRSGKQVIDVFNNCTEVHHMYDTIIRLDDKRIAFESDIHKTGCTRSVDDIECVNIESALSKEDEF